MFRLQWPLSMSDVTNTIRHRTSTAQWRPVPGAKLRFAAFPGWVLLLTHDGERSLAVWTNGRAVFAVPAADA